MTKKELIVPGAQKDIFSTEEPDKVIICFKDITTAFGGIKQAVLKGKGMYNNVITSLVFRTLSEAGIPNHFIGTISDSELLCTRVKPFPFHVIVRNRLAGTTAEMLGVEEGTRIPNTVYELKYRYGSLFNPMINEHHAVALGLVTYDEIHYIQDLARRVNETLRSYFLRAGIELVDFKMDCGRDSDGNIIVCDELSPDNCRLWDLETGEKLDKDRFRYDMSDVCASYRDVMERLLRLEQI